MNNRKINFRSCWLVDTPLENECVLVLRSRLITICFPAQSKAQSINGPVVLWRSGNTVNLLNQWMRPFTDGAKAVHWTVMLLHSIGLSEHRPRWIMTPLIKSVTRLRQPVRKAKFCYWTCHHTFHFSQIKSCIFPACFHSAFFFSLLFF